MSTMSKASSCTETGELDGWEVALAYSGELAPDGSTRVCATVPVAELPSVHLALVDGLAEPLSVLYRQKVDRRDPKPQAHPGRDFVGVELDKARVVTALKEAALLLYQDARCELWIRGGMNEQVVLDTDGTLYCYPDDPSFRDALDASGLKESESLVTLENRDYVRHWFRAEADALEDAFFSSLGLAEVAVQRG